MKSPLFRLFTLSTLLTLRCAAQSPHPLVDLTFQPVDNFQGHGYGPTIVTPGGRIIMAMAFYNAVPDENGVPQWRYVNEMRALHPDGSIDTSFTPVRGRGPGVVAPNGDIIIAKEPSFFGDSTTLVRTGAQGQVIWTQALPNNTVSSSGPRGVLLQKDGRIITYGMTGIQRYTASGELDESFFVSLPRAADVRSAALQENGRLVVARYDGGNGIHFFRLNSDGSVDESFHSRILPYGSGHCMSVLKDGRILTGGSGYEGQPGMLRFLPDGTPDSTFAAPPYAAECMAVQEDGRIIIGGYFLGGPVNGRANPALLTRLMPDGALDTSFGCPLCDYDNEDGQSVQSLALDAAGNVIANGTFFVPGTPLYGVVRLKTALPKREVQFALSTQDVREDAGWASVRVVRSGDAGSRASVAWSTRGITAQAFHDFIPGAGVLVFRSGETERTLRVRILADRRTEDPETLEVKLRALPANLTPGERRTTTLRILDAPKAAGGGR